MPTDFIVELQHQQSTAQDALIQARSADDDVLAEAMVERLGDLQVIARRHGLTLP